MGLYHQFQTALRFVNLIPFILYSDRSSLIYYTGGRQERHECDRSDTRTTRLRHKLKNFGFDNYTCKNIFSYSYIYYMKSETLQGEEQFHSKYYLCKCLIPMPKCI